MSDDYKLLDNAKEREVENGVEEEYGDEDSSRRARSSRRKQPSYFQDMLIYRPKWAGITTAPNTVKYLAILTGLTLASLLGLLFYTFYWMPLQIQEALSLAEHKAAGDGWVKPEGFRIVAIIFYGRPKFVNVLDCYLKKNLVSNGGFLDEVVFADNTNWQEDEDYLDQLVAGEELYSKAIMSHRGGWYHDVWNNLASDENTLYFKIDDDVVYIHDDAIPRLVNTLMAHPEAHAVGANIVNSPLTNWLHYHTEAVLPYLPDETVPKHSRKERNVTSWRASDLPRYAGSHSDKWELVEFDKRPEKGWEIGSKQGAPYDGHRWLPMADSAANLAITPIAAGAQYDPFGHGLYQWHIAAQQHYSLLERLEQGATDKYWFGNKDGIWNMHYTRYNLNFIAMWGSSVNMMSILPDDERAITVDIPQALKRKFLVDSHAIMAHWSFGYTAIELDQTDLLDRYRLYANEMVCTADNQKKPLSREFDPKGPKTPIEQ